MPDETKQEEVQYEKLPILQQGAVPLGEVKDQVTTTRDMGDLAYESVSFIAVPEGTSVERHVEIQIHEALRKPSLQWYEQVVLEKQLHDMRQGQRGKGRQGSKSGWSLRDTASELEIGLGTLSEDLRLAEAVLADPTLRGIQDKITAKRLILHVAKRIEAEAEAGLPSQFESDIVLCGNSAEILRRLPSGIFDVCFTDPPWIEYKDNRLQKDDQTLRVFQELYRVMKPESFLYAIVSTPDYYTYLTELAKIGWTVQHMPLIWAKQNYLSHGTRAWEYSRDYEPILLAVKGSPTLVMRGQASAIHTSPIVHHSRSIHPNEKPVDVPVHFLQHCSYENSLVIDPFGGSGVTGEACIKLNRRYVIIERNHEFFVNIEKRLKAAHMAKQAGSESV